MRKRERERERERALSQRDSDAAAVARLEGCWDRLWRARQGRLDDDYDALVARWGPLRAADPIALSVDLLSPIGAARHEPSHTQALGYLLDPAGDHGLGHQPLDLLLDVIAGELDEPSAAALEEAAAGWLDAAVVPERAALLRTEREETRRRTDLWIELPATAPRLLVVIENKIDDVARAGQLAAYEDAISARLAQLRARPEVVKVYLTVEGEAPAAIAGGAGWLTVSYAALALAWCSMVDGEVTAGRSFLRLYLATVFQKLLGVRFAESPSRAARAEIAAYLRLRLGEVPRDD